MNSGDDASATSSSVSSFDKFFNQLASPTRKPPIPVFNYFDENGGWKISPEELLRTRECFAIFSEAIYQTPSVHWPRSDRSGAVGGDELMVSACCKHFSAYDLELWGNYSRYSFNAIVRILHLLVRNDVRSCWSEVRSEVEGAGRRRSVDR
ncbi:hypothetical protein LXL04_005267 [Taraxacum kok-saghyz]